MPATVQAGTATSGTADRPSASVRVWDIPTRIFHWSFAASFAGAWLTSESERLRDLHVMLGYTFAALLTFRVVWGFVGSRYARFSSFATSPAGVMRYLRSLLSNKPEHHLGHNPAGAIAIFAMLVCGALIAVSGYATYQDFGGELFEELHEAIATGMLGLVVIHIAGVVVSSLLHRENLARAMITGRKEGNAGQGITRNHGLVGALLVAALLGAWWSWQAGVAPDFLPSGGSSIERHHDDD
jgi:cytochrome b